MESFSHQLQQFDPGIIWLDCDDQVIGINGVAAEVLEITSDQVVGQNIYDLHPPKSHNKIQWLMDNTRTPTSTSPAATMMINIPDRVLLIKVAKIIGAGADMAGTCMVFYDLTEVTTTPNFDDEHVHERPRQMCKLPVYQRNHLILLDLSSVIWLNADGHYTTIYTEESHYLSNLSLSDLQNRLDPNYFFRVHRSHIINIEHAREFWKEGKSAHLDIYPNGERKSVPVSRSKENELLALIGMK